MKRTLLRLFSKDESAGTAIEYGLIAAGISLAIVAVLHGMGSKLQSTYSQANAALGGSGIVQQGDVTGSLSKR